MEYIHTGNNLKNTINMLRLKITNKILEKAEPITLESLKI